MGDGLAVVLVGARPLDGLLLALLHALDALLELLGELLAVKGEQAVLARKVAGTVDVLDVHGDDVAGLDGTVLLDVLVGHLVAEELVDLPVDLGVGGLLGREVDLGGVIGGELGGGAHADGGVDDVVGALGGELGVGALGAKAHAAHGGDVELLEHHGLEGGEQVVGGLGEHGLAADDAVDHRTGRVAAAEALEVVLLGDVLVGLLDGCVDVGGGNGDLGGHLLVDGLLSGDGDLQRSSSVSCLAGLPRHVSLRGAGERTRTFTGSPPLEPKSSVSTSSTTPADFTAFI